MHVARKKKLASVPTYIVLAGAFPIMRLIDAPGPKSSLRGGRGTR